MREKIATMTNHVSAYYDRIYSENRTTFGTAPVPLVEKVLNCINSGRAIEFGAGEGRNSLFLASKGFQVTAIDISSAAIEKIKERAEAERIVVDAKVADITQLEPTDTYDLVVCTFTLHHLARNQALDFLEKMKRCTRSGGFNLVTSFTKSGDFYRKNPNTDKFYLDEHELKNLYSDWEVVTYFEKEGKAFAKHPDGTPMSNVVAGIIARRL